MNDVLKNKLTDLTDHYYFVSNGLEFLIDKIVEKAEQKYPDDEQMRYKYAMGLMKGIIKQKINDKVQKIPTSFFTYFFDEMSNEDNFYKLQLLSSIISCFDGAGISFYNFLLDNFQDTEKLLKSLIVEKDGRVMYYDENLLNKVSHVKDLFYLYGSRNDIKLEPISKISEKNKNELSCKKENSPKNENKRYTFQMFLDSHFEEEDQNKVLFLLNNPKKHASKFYFTEEEVSLIKKVYGENLDEINDIDDKKLKVKATNLIYTKLPVLVKRFDKKEVECKSFVEKIKIYTPKEQELIMDSLTQKDLLLLRRRFGDNLDEYNNKVDSYTVNCTNRIIYHVVPRMVKGLSRNYQINNCLLKEYLSYKYECTDEDFNLIINSLKISEIKALKKRYGENFDSYENGDDYDLSAQVTYIIFNKIPAILNVREKQSYIMSRKIDMPLNDYLKSKFSEQDINHIINSFTDEEIDILKKYYVNGYENMPKLDVDQSVKMRISNLLYRTIPERVKLINKGLNGSIVFNEDQKKTLKNK